MTNLLKTFLAFALLTSCQSTERSATQSSDKFYLISHAGAGDPFWNIEFNGAKKAAADLGLNVQIVSPETPNDIARQVELLNAAIATNPKGIALSIPDDNAFSQSLIEAQARGIRIVAFNAAPNANALNKNPYQAFIGMDEMSAGRQLAIRAWESGKLKTAAVVAMHQVGHVGLERRFAGIKEVLTSKGMAVEKLDITTDPSQAQQMLKGYLTKNKDISAVFFIGAHGLHATGRMLHELYPHLMLASFDLTPLTLELIKDGTVGFSIDQQPFMQSYMAITQLSLAARYALQPANMDTGVSIVDKNNILAVNDLVRRGVR